MNKDTKEKLSFFNNKEQSTDKLLDLEDEARTFLQDLILRWSKNNYKIREIQIVLFNLITELCMALIIRNKINANK